MGGGGGGVQGLLFMTSLSCRMHMAIQLYMSPVRMDTTGCVIHLSLYASHLFEELVNSLIVPGV